MKTTAHEEQLAALRLRAEQALGGFRDLPVCDPFSVLSWVGEKIDDFITVKTGEGARPVDAKSLTDSSRVVVLNEKPHLVLSAQWQYEMFILSPPDLTALDSLLPGVRIQPHSENNIQKALTADFIFDLDLWECFLPCIVQLNAWFAFCYKSVDAAVRAEAMADLAVLQSYYYPTLTVDVLALAADLGMLESIETCMPLCEKHCRTKGIEVTLPETLG